jgi:arylsulfatase A
MCAPARAALLTGHYPHRTGAVDVPECLGYDRIALRETTIADLFRSSGYATGIVGKWHNGAIDHRYHPRARGFDEFYGFRAGLVTSYWDCLLERNESFERNEGTYLTDVFTTEAISFIERHADEPFFLYLPYNAPHTPLEAPEEDVEPFRRQETLTEAVSIIYGMNRRMDAGIGRILTALDALGLDENTLVVFSSDNGPLFRGEGENDTSRWNGNWNGSKGDVLEGGIRVPAIARWPAGLPAGETVGAMTHFTDWLPTLLLAAGGTVPTNLALDGYNILPTLRGEDSGYCDSRIWQWNRYDPVPCCNAALREGPWKIYAPPIPEALEKRSRDNRRTCRIVDDPQSVEEIWTDPVERRLSSPPPPRLFNLEEDPEERHDLYGRHLQGAGRMHRDLLVRLQDLIRSWPGIQR